MSIIMRAEMAKVMTTPKSTDDASNKKHIEKNNADATSDTGNDNKAKTRTRTQRQVRHQASCSKRVTTNTQ